MEKVVLFIHILASIGLIGFVLIQHGKGAEAGTSLGGGASQTLFGSQGSGNFLTRMTAILVTLFFMSSLMLGYLGTHQNAARDLEDVLKRVETKASQLEQKANEDIPSIPEDAVAPQKNLEKSDLPSKR